MVTRLLFGLMLLFLFVPLLPALVFGPPAVVALLPVLPIELMLYRTLERHTKKEGRRPEPDGLQGTKKIFAENIIPQPVSVCQEVRRSRRVKMLREVFCDDGYADECDTKAP